MEWRTRHTLFTILGILGKSQCCFDFADGFLSPHKILCKSSNPNTLTMWLLNCIYRIYYAQNTHKRDGIRASTTFFVKFMKYTHDTTCIHIKTRLATKRRRSVGWCYILKPPQKKINFSCSKNKWAFLHISFVTDALDPFPYLNLFLPVLYFYSTVRLFSCGMHMRFSRVGPLVEKASFNT